MHFIGCSRKFGALRVNFGAHMHPVGERTIIKYKNFADNMESLKRLPSTAPNLHIAASG